MRKKLPFKWETIDIYTWRAKVIGGWMFHYCDDEGPALSFIPDREHEWEIVEPPVPNETKEETIESWEE